MDRTLFSEDHEIFRKSFRTFLQRAVVPNQMRWIEAGIVDRELWFEAGKAGFLCPWLEPEYGGAGGDFFHSVIVSEELSRVYESGFAAALHSDIVVPYIHEFGNEEQKKRWLPGCASGEFITSIAMTEPGTGSDLASIATTARRDGSDYVINGAKTFISNGILCDLCVLAAKTDTNPENKHGAISLFVVEANRKGFIKSKKLKKLGMHAQDTAELAFEDMRVPAANRLGEEGAGFMMLMRKLQQERLMVAIMAQAGAEQVLVDTVAYAKQRVAFGRPIAKFQNTQFKLVECATKLEVGRAFLDRLVSEHASGKYLVKECSMAKLWQTEMAGEVVDECLQLFGGYGYMLEYPVARAYMDARVARIYAGTNEIMKTIIAKQMDL
jgi:acyl-CoA dehydrogenase